MRTACIIGLLMCWGTACFAQQDVGNETFGRITAIENLNSESDDYAPCYDASRNLLYFNTVRDGYSYFYSTELKGDTFALPTILKGDINRTRRNQAYLCLLSETQAIYSAYSLKNDRSYFNLFSLYKKKGAWGSPKLLDSIASSDFSSQATVSTYGDFMIFSTTRETENYETDLWSARRQSNGTWGELVSLDDLNSPGSEMSPFLASDDTLYFASDGLGGAGGFDIFRSVKIAGVWQRPFPIVDLNTEFDESDLIVVADSLCFFASNRPGGKGGLDLYSAVKSCKPDILIDDTEFALSLSSTIHLVKIENNVSIYYVYDEQNNNFTKSAKNERQFSPEYLDLQFIAKPAGSFAYAKMDIQLEDGKTIASQNIENSTAEMRLKLSELFGSMPSYNSTAKIVTTAICKANFSISKSIEINFSEHETVNNRPIEFEKSEFGLLHIGKEVPDISRLTRFLHEEYARTILVCENHSREAEVNELLRNLDLEFKEVRKIAPKNPNSELIEIYFN